MDLLLLKLKILFLIKIKKTIDFVNKVKNDRNIKEKIQPKAYISSFNFTREAFKKSNWDYETIKSRGLYINTENYNIVARGYDKFFNYNEREETFDESLMKKISFPVNIYKKYNGFLGIVGYDDKEDELFITTKSDSIGDYAKYFKNILIEKNVNLDLMKDIIKKYNLSLLFEVIDINNDPHIIEYNNNNIVLLDAFKRNLLNEKLSYNQLKIIADELKLNIKECVSTIYNWESLKDFLNKTQLSNNHIEGYVIEDKIGFMFKIKTYYYNFWKRIRNLKYNIDKVDIDKIKDDKIKQVYIL